MDAVKEDKETVGASVEEATEKVRWSALTTPEGNSQEKKTCIILQLCNMTLMWTKLMIFRNLCSSGLQKTTGIALRTNQKIAN